MALPIITAALELAAFAPVIARWLGGKQSAEVAEKVIDISQKVTGTSDPLEAIQQLQGSAEMAGEFQKAIIQAEAEIELALLKDRQHARGRDTTLFNVGRSNVRADIMVIGAGTGLFLCLGSLALFNGMPGEVIGVISTIAGIFGACLKDAYSFEFGSSRSSREKDGSIAALIERNNL